MGVGELVDLFGQTEDSSTDVIHILERNLGPSSDVFIEENRRKNKPKNKKPLYPRLDMASLIIPHPFVSTIYSFAF